MLTEKQEVILDYVRRVQTEGSPPPSTRQVQRQLGCTQQAALQQLRALERRGKLQQVDGENWTLKGGEVQTHLDLPVYGTIPAGAPSLTPEQPKAWVRISTAGLPRTRLDELWALEVHGDSMEGAGIADGDLVVLSRREARAGDIVAALVDENTTTLKRLVFVAGRAVLQPENPRYGVIVPERSLSVQGVLVARVEKSERRASAPDRKSEPLSVAAA